MTAGSAASRRVLARTPVAPLPASSPTRPTGITGRMSAPPETSSPEVCSFRLPQMCGFRLPLTAWVDTALTSTDRANGPFSAKRFSSSRLLDLETPRLGLSSGDSQTLGACAISKASSQESAGWPLAEVGFTPHRSADSCRSRARSSRDTRRAETLVTPTKAPVAQDFGAAKTEVDVKNPVGHVVPSGEGFARHFTDFPVFPWVHCAGSASPFRPPARVTSEALVPCLRWRADGCGAEAVPVLQQMGPSRDQSVHPLSRDHRQVTTRRSGPRAGYWF